MGTSQTSTGPGANVPMVPPWVPPINSPPPLPPPPPDQAPLIPLVPTQVPIISIAPPRRFADATKNLRKFSESGSQESLRRGLGHYVKNGLRGAAMGTRRMAGTARTGQILYSALSDLAGGQGLGALGGPERDLLLNASAGEIIDTLVVLSAPIDGTLDSESSRVAVHDSLAELLEHFPDANLLALSEDQRLFVLQEFISREITQRVMLDIGRRLGERASSATVAAQRVQEMQEYIRGEVDSAFSEQHSSNAKVTRSSVASLTTAVIAKVLYVFEDYIK